MQIIKKNNIKEIITALKKGAVLVFPTDTVYGLICDAGSRKAVSTIFRIKKRDKSKTLGIFVRDVKSASKIAFVGKNEAEILGDNTTTLILEAKKKTLSKLVYKRNTIGIRIPKYKLLNLVLEKFNKPIAQTSANISGEKATVKIKDILMQFRDEDISVVDVGDLPKNKPSAIIDLTDNNIKIIRK
jgi:L-threonylcarbamoyladenylate synthase